MLLIRQRFARPTIVFLVGFFVTVGLAAFDARLAAAQSSEQRSRWVLEAFGFTAAPVDPQEFVDGWRSGLGIGGSLRARVGAVEVGVEGDFAQFGFDGLENLGTLGGERRMTRLALPVRFTLWKDDRRAVQRLYLQASGGWGHQSVAATFGGVLASGSRTDDGFVGTLGVRYARSLYRRTLWSVGVRYTRFEFDAESPSTLGLLLGVQMPLSGSRPRTR